VLILVYWQTALKIMFLAAALHALWWTKDSEKFLKSLRWTAFDIIFLTFYLVPIFQKLEGFSSSQAGSPMLHISVYVSDRICLSAIFWPVRILRRTPIALKFGLFVSYLSQFVCVSIK